MGFPVVKIIASGFQSVLTVLFSLSRDPSVMTSQLNDAITNHMISLFDLNIFYFNIFITYTQ